MYDGINIKELIEYQKTERYKSIILHDTAATGKSSLVKKISEQVKGEYIDLLEEFHNNKELKNNIEIFSPKKLE